MFESQQEQGNYSPRHRFQIISGAHPASYLMVIGDSFSGGKTTGLWSWPLTSTECRCQRMREAIFHSPSTTSGRGAQLKQSTRTTLQRFESYGRLNIVRKSSDHISRPDKVNAEDW